MSDKTIKRLIWIVPLTILSCVLLYLFFGWDILTKMHPDRVAYDMAQLTARVNEDLDAGKESGIFFVSKDVSVSEIDGINDYICSMNGMVDQYTVTERLPKGIRVRFKYEISDNYYAYEYLMKKTPIPADRPLARQLADTVEKILKDEITDGMSEYEKELALHDYVVTHCAYGFVDSSKTYAYRAYGVLLQQRGVCNGYAEALALLYSCAGIENRIVTGYAEEELHAWNQIKIGGHWYMVDATWDDPLPDRAEYAGHAYFNVTDDILGATHTWTREDYEPCTVLNDNYYNVKGLVLNHTAFESVARSYFDSTLKYPLEVVLTDYSTEYDLNFLYEIEGVRKVSYTQPVSYGSNKLVTFYINAE